MVVYLDLVFIINSLSDALGLYITSRLSGLSVRPKRFMIAVMLGGIYGVLCLLPQLNFVGSAAIHMIFAFLMVRLVFGKQKILLRIFSLFFVLSCTLGGAMIAIAQYISVNGITNTAQNLDWKVFLLVSGMSYFFLSVVFRGSARHIVAGQICRAELILNEETVSFDVLLDTGHTLCDPFTGKPVLTVWYKALEPIWSENESLLLDGLESEGSVHCAERLGMLSPGKFRLIPYRAVGVSGAMLLAFQADKIVLDGENLGTMTVALSPTAVSDGGSYTALWGGERKGKTENAA